MRYKPDDPTDGMPSAHYTPLPDIGEWKFESDFTGDQFRYTNPKYQACICWIRRKRYDAQHRLVIPIEWRILLPSGNYGCGANGKTLQYKSPERAIKTLERDYE